MCIYTYIYIYYTLYTLYINKKERKTTLKQIRGTAVGTKFAPQVCSSV